MSQKTKTIIYIVIGALSLLAYTTFIILVTQSLIKDNITKRGQLDKIMYEKSMKELQLQLDDVKKKNEEQDKIDSILFLKREVTVTGIQNIKSKYDLERKKLHSTSFDTLAKSVARKVSEYNKR